MIKNATTKVSQLARRAALGLTLAFTAVAGVGFTQDASAQSRRTDYHQGYLDGIREAREQDRYYRNNSRHSRRSHVYSEPCTTGDVVSGAVAGAVLGAIIGDNKKSARRGAVVGAVVNCLPVTQPRYDHRYDPSWQSPRMNGCRLDGVDRRGREVWVCPSPRRW